jgi:hypothetical protein
MALAQQAHCAAQSVCVPARARRLRCRAVRPPRASAATTDPERFVWKGGGNGRGAAWEAAALEGRGGYATDSAGRQWFFLDAGPVSGRPLVLLHGMPAYRRACERSSCALRFPTLLD